MIRLVENKTTGIYNGSGPGFKMTTNAFVHGIHAIIIHPLITSKLMILLS
jgi:hypothetical protein